MIRNFNLDSYLFRYSSSVHSFASALSLKREKRCSVNSSNFIISDQSRNMTSSTSLLFSSSKELNNDEHIQSIVNDINRIIERYTRELDDTLHKKPKTCSSSPNHMSEQSHSSRSSRYYNTIDTLHETQYSLQNNFINQQNKSIDTQEHQRPDAEDERSSSLSKHQRGNLTKYPRTENYRSSITVFGKFVQLTPQSYPSNICFTSFYRDHICIKIDRFLSSRLFSFIRKKKLFIFISKKCRPVTKFFTREGLKATEISKELENVYKDDALSYHTVAK